MTLNFSAGEPGPDSLLADTEALYRDIAKEVFAAISRIRANECNVRDLTETVRKLRQFLHHVLEERKKVAKLSDGDGGSGHGRILDLDEARIEIGRRLARLRDAGGD